MGLIEKMLEAAWPGNPISRRDEAERMEAAALIMIEEMREYAKANESRFWRRSTPPHGLVDAFAKENGLSKLSEEDKG